MPLELELATALRDFAATAAHAAEVAEQAREVGDAPGELAARIRAAHARTQFASDPRFDELEALARSALPELERAEYHSGLVWAWLALADVANISGRNEESAHAAERALHHARLAGARPTGLFGLAAALDQGPTPADEALQKLEAVVPENPSPGVEASRALLLAMLGRFDEAWPIARSAAARQRELTGEAMGASTLGDISFLARDFEGAVEHMRVFCEFLERRHARSILSSWAPKLGRALCALGRYDEAEALAKRGRELGDEQDHATQTLWRQVQALVHAARGEHAEAATLAREAVAIAAGTDALNAQADALADLAEVLRAGGSAGEAAAVLEQALDRYERKKNLAMLAQMRPKLEGLRKAAPA